MKIALAADSAGQQLKESIKLFLEAGKNSYQISDLSNPDIFTATMSVVNAINEKKIERGIIIDDYAIAPFMIANKNHGIICASVYEDYTSKMTRTHNNTQIICLSSNITAKELACAMANNFLESEYAGGRHQIRVDMLNRMV